MWFDGQRQPNTVYVANTSRGKDSTAMLRAIQLMGWPLDMICAVDIWFDADTPAELPPMVAFKDDYDSKVLKWFGVPVTRLCATQRERESWPPRIVIQVVILRCILSTIAARTIHRINQRFSHGQRPVVQETQNRKS